MRRRKGAPWFQDVLARGRFERGAREQFPGLGGMCSGRKAKDEVTYVLTVAVPEYEPRRVKIRLLNHFEPLLLSVTVDGPSDRKASLHRYRKGELCIWEPTDGPDKRWVSQDGLLALIRQIQVHLFKEAWWRETGQWIGEEVLHMPGEPKAA